MLSAWLLVTVCAILHPIPLDSFVPVEMPSSLSGPSGSKSPVLSWMQAMRHSSQETSASLGSSRSR